MIIDFIYDKFLETAFDNTVKFSIRLLIILIHISFFVGVGMLLLYSGFIMILEGNLVFGVLGLICGFFIFRFCITSLIEASHASKSQ